MKAIALVLAATVIGASAVLADAPPLNTGDLKWGDAPPVLPKGAKLAVVSGDPGGKGIYVVRLKMPAGYRIPAHNHPTAEYVTVLSGTFNIGMGDKFDPKQGKKLGPGGFAEAPAGMNHYAWTTAETIVQVHGEGPFAMTYVNPADDPSTK